MLTDDHLSQLPGPGWKLRLSPERKMVIATAPDGTSKIFDTPDEAINWANNPEDVAAWRRHLGEIEAKVVDHARKRARAQNNHALPAPGWTVRHRRATDDWEAVRGVQREVFDSEEEAIAFTHEE